MPASEWTLAGQLLPFAVAVKWLFWGLLCIAQRTFMRRASWTGHWPGSMAISSCRHTGKQLFKLFITASRIKDFLNFGRK